MTTIDEMLKTPMEQMSHKDRTRLTLALLDSSPTRCLETGEEAMLILSADDIAPDERRCVSGRSFVTFIATRLIVLGTERERSEMAVVEATTTRGALWWKRTTSEMRSSTTSRMVSTPAEAWDVASIFCGSANVLPATLTAPAPASMFAADPSPLSFRVTGGYDVTLQVRHHMTGLASFRAVLLGRRVQSEEAAS